MSPTSQLVVFILALVAVLSHSIPLRELVVHQRPLDDAGDMLYFMDENRSKRGAELLKRRAEIIERNRCFFNPITCY
ncbi:unnamed protein product [Caenorhabditis bovis]|uniref:Uncharacterized protein n=1 Tax=Caenorhabditis bovis TaxID=2654633 RepID=A0A8S1F157_9PELO|nr:unnamed protein product [Caenorhabditis bovis]